MSQTIALHAKAPQISLADVMQEVQRSRENDLKLQGMERDNQLDAITKGQQIDEANALGRYRTRQGAKDPAAIEELDAYPEQQKKLYEAFDGMSPQQYMDAGKKANAFGAAARRVSAFAEGSPQQAQVWAEEIDRLAKDGYIDPKSAEQWKAQGPNMAIINEALTIGDWVKGYKGKNALEQARIEEIKGRTKNAEKKTEGQLDRYRTQNDKDAFSIEDKGIDNERADKDLERKNRQGDERNAIAARKKQGLADSGMTESEYGRRINNVQKIIEKRREEEGLDDAQVLALERELRKKYRIPVSEPSISGLDEAGGKGAAAGNKKDMYTDPKALPPPMTERVPGRVYPSPNGPLEWTENGWRKATNG